jgi:hypothetical protein
VDFCSRLGSRRAIRIARRRGRARVVHLVGMRIDFNRFRQGRLERFLSETDVMVRYLGLNPEVNESQHLTAGLADCYARF